MLSVIVGILWRRALTENNSDDYLPLAQFKLGLAEILTRSHVTSKKRGRPNSSLQPQLDLKKRKYPFAEIPAQEIRRDNVGHLPE
ncbi:unnamed protein product [Acanthoscelides obtectus]|uniref:Uncharacterized protein n=1 Tax=Acanthoscelides obtectus TaxID=200917 RepID=A0A9P0P250_ACAOB|nr:unnamed protein product [Acanthoscelides obtectus]CAK1633832.1 hypothetical protein AOBTE_LOCUS8419 [Acanthoscelides obtectus]